MLLNLLDTFTFSWYLLVRHFGCHLLLLLRVCPRGWCGTPRWIGRIRCVWAWILAKLHNEIRRANNSCSGWELRVTEPGFKYVQVISNVFAYLFGDVVCVYLCLHVTVWLFFRSRMFTCIYYTCKITQGTKSNTDTSSESESEAWPSTSLQLPHSLVYLVWSNRTSETTLRYVLVFFCIFCTKPFLSFSCHSNWTPKHKMQTKLSTTFSHLFQSATGSNFLPACFQGPHT